MQRQWSIDQYKALTLIFLLRVPRLCPFAKSWESNSSAESRTRVRIQLIGVIFVASHEKWWNNIANKISYIARTEFCLSDSFFGRSIIGNSVFGFVWIPLNRHTVCRWHSFRSNCSLFDVSNFDTRHAFCANFLFNFVILQKYPKKPIIWILIKWHMQWHDGGRYRWLF